MGTTRTRLFIRNFGQVSTGEIEVFLLSASGRTLLGMDFEEDRMALEAYIREKTLWRDEDEVSPEEWAHYAWEYMCLNPIPIQPIMIDNEDLLVYNRASGQFDHYKVWLLPPIMWQPGHFAKGLRDSIEMWSDSIFVGTPARFLHWRFWFEYVGLAAPRRHFPPHFAQVED